MNLISLFILLELSPLRGAGPLELRDAPNQHKKRLRVPSLCFWALSFNLCKAEVIYLGPSNLEWMMLLRCHCCHQEDTFIKRLEASLGKSNSDSGLIYLASKFTHVLHTIVNHFQLNKMGLESRRVHHGKIIPNVIGVPRPLVSSCLALSPAVIWLNRSYLFMGIFSFSFLPGQ